MLRIGLIALALGCTSAQAQQQNDRAAKYVAEHIGQAIISLDQCRVQSEDLQAALTKAQKELEDFRAKKQEGHQ